MKFSKIILLILLIVFVGIQFIPTKHNLSDSIPDTDFMKANNVPQDITKIVQTSCYDCHSNNTNYPWYSYIQPARFFMENHIEEGKENLNFNEWGKYSKRKQENKLYRIAKQIKSDEMPLAAYTLILRNSILTTAQKREVIG